MCHFSAHDPPFRIGLILVDGFALMSYASVVEPLRAANLLSGSEVFEVRNYAASGHRAVSSGQARIQSDGDILRSGHLDMVLVVAGGSSRDVMTAPVIAPTLRELDRQKVILGGVSGGPLLLAQAGLMNDRRMTVHWEHAPTLAEMSSSLMIERSLYVIDRNRVTCAGGIAPVDMMHAMILRLYGNRLATKVSDWLMHTHIRPSGSAQRSGLAERYNTTNRIVLDTIVTMQNHIADPLSLEQLAARVGVSPRQLGRVFASNMAKTTMAFYRDLRLDHACNLMSNSSLTMTRIALATGFGGSAHFSTAFGRRFGHPPSGWNRTFR